MDDIYETVILSDVLEDDERFRKIIDDAIARDDVPDFPAYSKETKKKRDGRIRRAKLEAQAEAKEAESYAKELGVHDKLFGGVKGKKSKENSEDSLAALIQRRQQDRSSNSFFDHLEEKYGASSKGKKGKKREMPEEPPEEAFLATAARRTAKASDSAKTAKKSKR
jgi:DnaJ homolog subfamily C member 9